MGTDIQQQNNLPAKNEFFDDLVQRAEQGDVEACAKVGHIYAVGDHNFGIPPNRELSAKYYEKGAQSGDLACMFGLAGAYLHLGQADKAIRLLETCAQRKHLWSLAILGDFYLRGSHVPRDPHKARFYLQEYTELCRPGAIPQGAFNARWDVVLYPLCLLLGVGGAKDENEARRVLGELAALGNLSAGEILRSGRLKDPTVAERFQLDVKSRGPVTLFEAPNARPNIGGGFGAAPLMHKPAPPDQKLAGFLKKALIPGERILMNAKFPRIYIVDALITAILFLYAGFWLRKVVIEHSDKVYEAMPDALYRMIFHWPSFYLPVFVLGGIGLLYFLMKMIEMWTTHIVLTDRRFIVRTGLLSIDMVQINFWQIEHTDVSQSFLGNMLDYGHVLVQSYALRPQEQDMAGGMMRLPLISHPYLFTRLIEDNRKLPYRGGHGGGGRPFPPQ
jgi:hypothetical protein